MTMFNLIPTTWELELGGICDGGCSGCSGCQGCDGQDAGTKEDVT